MILWLSFRFILNIYELHSNEVGSRRWEQGQVGGILTKGDYSSIRLMGRYDSDHVCRGVRRMSPFFLLPSCLNLTNNILYFHPPSRFAPGACPADRRDVRPSPSCHFAIRFCYLLLMLSRVLCLDIPAGVLRDVIARTSVFSFTYFLFLLLFFFTAARCLGTIIVFRTCSGDDEVTPLHCFVCLFPAFPRSSPPPLGWSTQHSCRWGVRRRKHHTHNLHTPQK